MYTYGGLSAPPLLADGGGGGGAGSCGSAASAGAGNIPRTPEILNSLIAMTNPLDTYSYPSTAANAASNQNQGNQQQFDSHSSCSASPLDSPASATTPPSVQQTRTQLIKAGIKLHIQNKRKYSGCDSSGNESVLSTNPKHPRKDSSVSNAASTSAAAEAAMDNLTSEDDASCQSKSPRGGLTPEDEDRRRRRRERNKIAATKCRMKKRERTANLINESEVMESQNIELKNEIRNLENQRRKLMEILQAHSTRCVHQGGYQPLPSVSTLKNCKYLNDLQDFSPTDGSTHTELPEIKYSHTLKQCEIQQLLHDDLHGQQQQQQQQQQPQPSQLLPHGYCKPSPTETGYVLSPDSGFVRSPCDLDAFGAMEHHPAPRTASYIPTNEPMMNNNCNPDAEFILKSELIDSHSPYTSLHSADRFLFEGDAFDDSKLGSGMCQGQQGHMVMGKEVHLGGQQGSIQMMMEMNANFDAIKADFLGTQTQEFIAMAEGTETQFTDLDSGIIKSLNNGCLV